jgi:transcriptional regulator with XRE-family HTH domain
LRRHAHEGQKPLGEAIRTLRRQKGLTQDELGKRSEIHGTQISRIENGYVDPTFGNVRRIAAALEVSLTRLGEEEARIEGRRGLPPRLSGAGAFDEIDVGVRFGEPVRRLRQIAGLLQLRLAERCDMQEEAAGEIECGRSLPMLDALVKLIASLGTTAAELFEALPLWLPDVGGTGHFSCVTTGGYVSDLSDLLVKVADLNPRTGP